MAMDFIKIDFAWMEATQTLTDAEKGRLVTDLVLYARDGVEPEDFRGNERYVFPVFKAQVDREKQRREQNAACYRNNGKKGGRPRKSESAEAQKNQSGLEKPKRFTKNQKNQSGFSDENQSGFYGCEEVPEDTENPANFSIPGGSVKNQSGFADFSQKNQSGFGERERQRESEREKEAKRESERETERERDQEVEGARACASAGACAGAREVIPFAAYCKQLGVPLGNSHYDEIREFYEYGITDEVLNFALDESIAMRKESFAYVRKCVNSWIIKGLRTIDEVRAESKRKVIQPVVTGELAANDNPRPAPIEDKPLPKGWDVM